MKIRLVPENKHNKFDFKRECYVDVCQFTFRFYSVFHLEEAIGFFSTKTHPSTANGWWQSHHEAQPWHCRIPQYLIDNHHRPKVLKALQAALEQWKVYNDRFSL